MKRWRHLTCGKVDTFPDGVDPRKRQDPCSGCWISNNQWVPA